MLIFLTHSHRDHIACLDEILEFTGDQIFHVHNSEKMKKIQMKLMRVLIAGLAIDIT